VDYGESKGIFKTVSDEEHVKIIDSYLSRIKAREL
jgi:hypothetical protein